MAGVLALVVALGGATAVATIADGGSTAWQQSDTPTFLGYRVGEQVRYALEGDDGRERDRTVHWTITLVEVDAGGAEGTFALSYLLEVPGVRLQQAAAEATVNQYGFPTDVVFTSQRVTPAGTIGYSIEYQVRDDQLHKEMVGGGFRDQETELDGYPRINLSFPRGMFLYNPIDAECARALAEEPFAGTTGGDDGAPEIEELCNGRELVFANPGLLTLVMPTLYESGTGSLGFVAFAPTGMKLDLFTAAPGSSSPLTVGGMPIGAMLGGGPNPFNDGEAALQRFRLDTGSDLLQIEVGGRMVDAWRLDPPPRFTSVYVDGNGSIVRLDLPEDPEAGGSAWIRRLRPSEY